MAGLSDSGRSYTDDQIDAMLVALNESNADAEAFPAVAAQQLLPAARIVDREAGFRCVRLRKRDARGRPVVLMLLEGAWERAI